MWEYWTPIYILDTIITLEFDLEIITSETAHALHFLVKQQTKIQNAICQIILASDYLLGKEEEFVEGLT